MTIFFDKKDCIPCSHFIGNKCKNGFPVTGPCHGIPGKPICMDEDWSAFICNKNDGLPYGFPRNIFKKFNDSVDEL